MQTQPHAEIAANLEGKTQMITLKDMMNSVACAIAVLEGTAGGYTEHEKMNAKLTLMKVKSELAEQLNITTYDPGEVSVKQQLFLGGK